MVAGALGAFRAFPAARGKQEAVVIDIQEYQRLRRLAEGAEEAWLNQLADQAESESL